MRQRDKKRIAKVEPEAAADVGAPRQIWKPLPMYTGQPAQRGFRPILADNEGRDSPILNDIRNLTTEIEQANSINEVFERLLQLGQATIQDENRVDRDYSLSFLIKQKGRVRLEASGQYKRYCYMLADIYLKLGFTNRGYNYLSAISILKEVLNFRDAEKIDDYQLGLALAYDLIDQFRLAQENFEAVIRRLDSGLKSGIASGAQNNFQPKLATCYLDVGEMIMDIHIGELYMGELADLSLAESYLQTAMYVLDLCQDQFSLNRYKQLSSNIEGNLRLLGFIRADRGERQVQLQTIINTYKTAINYDSQRVTEGEAVATNYSLQYLLANAYYMGACYGDALENYNKAHGNFSPPRMYKRVETCCDKWHREYNNYVMHRINGTDHGGDSAERLSQQVAISRASFKILFEQKKGQEKVVFFSKMKKTIFDAYKRALFHPGSTAEDELYRPFMIDLCGLSNDTDDEIIESFYAILRRHPVGSSEQNYLKIIGFMNFLAIELEDEKFRPSQMRIQNIQNTHRTPTQRNALKREKIALYCAVFTGITGFLLGAAATIIAAIALSSESPDQKPINIHVANNTIATNVVVVSSGISIKPSLLPLFIVFAVHMIFQVLVFCTTEESVQAEKLSRKGKLSGSPRSFLFNQDNIGSGQSNSLTSKPLV